MHQIDILAFDQAQLLDVTGPLQPFATVNQILQGRGEPAFYQTRVISPAGGQVMTSSGLGLETAPLPDPQSPNGNNTLLIAGGPGVHLAARDPDLLAWLKGRMDVTHRAASVCTGAFLLAATGALDGKRAVTHWAYCDRLKQEYPAIRVEADPIFICQGPLWTSAGITSGIDLALALIEEDLGRNLALATARHLVVFLKRPGGQAQFSTALDLQSADDRFAPLHDWISTHLNETITLPRMAEIAGMSERSFSRHYLGVTGITPVRALEKLRLEAARQLLSESRQSIKSIARRVGFGTEETMRRTFIRHLGTSPQDYRQRFKMTDA